MPQQVSHKQLIGFDAWAFCKAGDRFDTGDFEWVLERLDDEPLVHSHKLNSWSVVGRQNARGDCYLDINAELSVALLCVACGHPVDEQLTIRRSLLLKHREVDVDEVDPDELDEDTDVVACPNSINLIDWFEDELLLSLPQFPRHEACAPQLTEDDETSNSKYELSDLDADEPQPKVKPFANLADLIKAKK